jgi:transposase InsO family protein
MFKKNSELGLPGQTGQRPDYPGIADVIDYIDSFYNLKRRHYRLGNVSPNEYERRLQQCA